MWKKYKYKESCYLKKKRKAANLNPFSTISFAQRLLFLGGTKNNMLGNFGPYGWFGSFMEGNQFLPLPPNLTS